MAVPENSPLSSPGDPAAPLRTARIATGTISPESSANASPVSVSLTAWPSPAKVACSGSVKVNVPIPAEESRTQTPCAPCAGVAVGHRGQRGGALRAAAPVFDRQRPTGGRCDGGGQVGVAAHGHAAGRDDEIAQAQPGRLGRVLGPEGGVLVRKSDDERAVGKHLDAERRAADQDGAPRRLHSAHRFDRQHAEQAQRRVLAAAGGCADRGCGGVRCRCARLQKRQRSERERTAGLQIQRIRHGGAQRAPRGQRRQNHALSQS